MILEHWSPLKPYLVDCLNFFVTIGGFTSYFPLEIFGDPVGNCTQTYEHAHKY